MLRLAGIHRTAKRSAVAVVEIVPISRAVHLIVILEVLRAITRITVNRAASKRTQLSQDLRIPLIFDETVDHPHSTVETLTMHTVFHRYDTIVWSVGQRFKATPIVY